MDLKNPFFILRLPANATTVEIKRAGQKALASARLNDEPTAKNASRIRDVEDAIEKLRDPLERVRLGIEWPSLSPHGAAYLRDHADFADLICDPHLEATAHVEALLAQESAQDRTHAIAVFSLLRAHELLQPQPQSSGKPVPPKQSDVATGAKLLAHGLRHWLSVVGSREFWVEQRMRAKGLGDPRIDSSMLSKLEASGPHLPLARFALVAQDALHRRDVACCKQVVLALQASGFPPNHLDDALGTIYAPICARASAAIDALTDRLRKEKSTTATPYQALLKQYETEVGSDVDMILHVGDLPGYAEEIVRDKSSEFLRMIAVGAANNASAFDVSAAALAHALRAANSPALCAKLEADQVTVNGLAESAKRAPLLAPHHEALSAALKQGDFAGAIATIDRLIALESTDGARKLQEIRRRVCTNWATALFNQGVEEANSKNFSRAISLLEQALSLESVAAERLIISNTLDQVRTAKADHRPAWVGCLGQLVVGAILWGIVAALRNCK